MLPYELSQLNCFIPASCVISVVTVTDVNPVAVLVAVTLTEYRMPSSRPLMIAKLVDVVPLLEGIAVQGPALLLNVAVYWFAGRPGALG